MDFLSLTLNKGDFNEAYIDSFQQNAKKTQNNTQDDTLTNVLSDYKNWVKTNHPNDNDCSIADYVNQLDDKSDAYKNYQGFLGLEKSNKIEISDKGTIQSIKSNDAKSTMNFDKNGAIVEPTPAPAPILDKNAKVPEAHKADIPEGATFVETKKSKNGSFDLYKNADGTNTNIRYDASGNKISEIKKDKDNKHKLSEVNFKDGKKTDETTFDADGKEKTKTEYDKDGKTKIKATSFEKDKTTETTFGKDEKGQPQVTIRTFNDKGALTSTKTGKTEEEATKAENTATKDGTARKTDESLKDAALIDKDMISDLAKSGDLKKLTSNLQIKGTNGKELKTSEIETALKSGDLELYQNKDGDYSINSKVEPDAKDKDKTVEKYKIEEKKDFFSKAMDSGDPMQMMMAMFFMNMMGGMMGNMGGMNANNPYMAQLTGQGQQVAQSSPASGREAFQRRGVVSFFDGSYRKGREEAKAAKLENEYA